MKHFTILPRYKAPSENATVSTSRSKKTFPQKISEMAEIGSLQFLPIKSIVLETAQANFKSFAVRLSAGNERFAALNKNKAAACSAGKFNLCSALINDDFKQNYYAAAEQTDISAAIFL